MDERHRTERTVSRRPFSLRTRYLIVTSFLTYIIFASAWMAQEYVARTGDESRQRIETRVEAGTHLRRMRNAIQETEKRLDEFFWYPSPTNRAAVNQSVRQVVDGQRRLYGGAWLEENRVKQQLDDFAHDIDSLQQTVDFAMDTRLHQPGSSTGERLLRLFTPSDQHFTQVVGELLDLLAKEPDGAAALNRAERLQGTWQEMRSLYTLFAEGYRHTREAPRDGAGLERVVDAIHEVDLAFAALGRALNPPPSTAIDSTMEALGHTIGSWKGRFSALQDPTMLSGWQDDITYLKYTTRPFFDHLWEYVHRIDAAIEEYAREDVLILTDIGRNIVIALWVLAFVGLCFIVIGFIYFERAVLKPIALVARALRLESLREGYITLPAVQSRETENLIDAFYEMRRQVHQRQSALEHLALHDPLTDLPNRVLFHERVEEEVGRQTGEARGFALLVTGIDRFKSINDTLGHHTGDEILRAFSRRIGESLPSGNTLARLGSDEFAILLPGQGGQGAVGLARQLLAAFEAPIQVDGKRLYLSCSFGIACYPFHGEGADTLLRNASIALYLAKRSKTQVLLYDTSQDAQSTHRLAVANELREAIQQRRMTVVFQPQITVADRKFFGMEVLLRWHHPQDGEIRPDIFIPLAEQTGLINPLTDLLIEETFTQCQAWRRAGLDYGVVAINVSAFNLHDAEFVSRLSRCLEHHQIPPQTVMVEITESAMMADPAHALETLQRLDRLGVQLAIDDFGTGFSSLSYLKRLPVSKLKIDKSFVSEMNRDDNDAVIVRSTIDLAHNLGLTVVAEGVDKEETLELLDILGCDYAQGYLISRPLEADELTRRFLHTREPRVPEPLH